MPQTRVSNPFRFGSVATGEYFTNRTQEQRGLVADVEAGQDVFIASPRRFGKTSLIQQVRRTLQRAGVLTAYVDLYTATTPAQLTTVLAAAFNAGLFSTFQRARQQATRLISALPTRPKIVLGDDGLPGIELAPPIHQRDVEQYLESLLMLPQQIAIDRNRRVALILDEFQEVVAIDPMLPNRMRAIFQQQADVAHVYLGSRQHTMQHLFTSRNEPFYRSAKHVQLGPIAHREFAHFIRARFGTTRVAVDEAAIIHVLQVTDGHPADTQELCYFLWDLAVGREAPASRALVEEALGLVLASEQAGYMKLWDRISRPQRLLLQALAREPAERLYDTAYLARHRLPGASSAQKAAEALLEAELIVQRDGAYRVAETFFGLWVQRTFP